ncbi:hypothetical protein [Bdellovibrio bacteriovorus]|uniref:hypothetical protein n=1 Tax=Bdellovibrio bacteriovorus TaxID=959 RepID=UPI003AA97FA1
MSSKFWADRATVEVNGFELVGVKDFGCNVNENVTQVDHMAKNYRGAGFKRGNRTVSGSFTLDVPEKKAQIDLAVADKSKIVNIVFYYGGERHQVVNLTQQSVDHTASVGDANKKINFIALDCVNERGQAVNADVGL